jgi:hypothetical protein
MRPRILLIPALLLTGTLAAQQPGPADAAVTRVVDDEERGAFVVSVGPMELPHGGDHHGEHAGIFPPVATVQIPRAAYLYGFDLEIVDGAGRRLPNRLLHHLNVIDPDRRELFLPIAQRLLALGSETSAESMPWLLFGLPVKAGQSMVISVMMHNPTEEHYRDVELRLTLKYVPHGRPWPLFSVYPYQLDVAFPAGDKSFDLPPGESSRWYDARPAIAGRLMVVGGHLHELATSLKLEDVTTGTVIWEGRPIAGPDGVVSGVTIGRLYRRLGVKIRPDHTYRVSVQYNNTTGDTIPAGGMGVVAGVFMPEDEAQWPSVDTADALYQVDRKHFMREVRGKYAELVGAPRPPVTGKGAAHVHHD